MPPLWNPSTAAAKFCSMIESSAVTTAVLPWIGAGLLALGIPAAGVAIAVKFLGFEGVIGSISRFAFGNVVRVVPWGRKRYAALSTSADLNRFLGTNVYPFVVELSKPRIEVEWVLTAEEACKVEERTEGELIVRLRHETVPMHNQILGLMACVERIFFPHAWPHFSESLRSAIQLHFAGALAAQLGGPASRYFSLEILKPALTKDPKIGALVDRLKHIEDAGLFEVIFLQELVELSDGLVRVANPMIAQECEEFVDWLEQFAIRETGSENELEFLRQRIKLALLPAAKYATAARGTMPYETWMRRKIFNGARNVYLIGLTRAHHEFAEQIYFAIREMPWVRHLKTARTATTKNGVPDQRFIALFSRNEHLLQNKTFKELVGERGVVVGVPTECVVRDVAGPKVLLRHDYLDVVVNRGEVAWGFMGSPGALLEEGLITPLVPREVNEDRKIVVGSIKRVFHDDAAILSLLSVGTRYEVEVVEVDVGVTVHVRLLLDTALAAPVFGRIEWALWSHFAPDADGWIDPIPEVKRHATLVELNLHSNAIELSCAAVPTQDWETAMLAYNKGRSVPATVHAVDPDGVVCMLAPNVRGRVSAERMRQAGFEFVDFQANVKVGQVLHVVVVTAKVERQFLQLDLARNQASGPSPTR